MLPSFLFDTHVRLCGWDGTNCNWGHYVSSVGRFGAPVIVAALVIICFVGFVLLRTCNGCGGRFSSFGFCPDKRAERRSYTRRERRGAKIAISVIAIAIIGCAIAGMALSKNDSQKIKYLIQEVQDTATSAITAIQVVGAEVIGLPFSENATEITQDTLNAAQQVQSRMNSVRSLASKLNTASVVFIFVGFVTAALLAVLGIVSAALNLRRLSFVGGLLGFWICAIVWISFGICLVLAKLSFDACAESGLFIGGLSTSNDAVSGSLTMAWGCGPNSYFGNFSNTLVQGENSAVSESCKSISTVCSFPNVHCPSVPCNTANVPFLVSNTFIMDGSVNRTVASCALACENNVYREGSQMIVQDIGYYNNYTALLAYFAPFGTCGYVSTVVDDLNVQFCGPMGQGYYGGAVTNLITGVLLIALIVLLIIGKKRFRRIHTIGGGSPPKPRSFSNVGLLQMEPLHFSDKGKMLDAIQEKSAEPTTAPIKAME